MVVLARKTLDPIKLHANAGRLLSIPAGNSRLTASESGAKFPTFDILAYTGGVLNLPALDLPCVFDLAETQVAPAGVPALYQHAHERIVGTASDVVIDTAKHEIRAKAIANSAGPDAELVRANARQGYQWQVSVGLHSDNLVKLAEGQSATVNGRTWSGPMYIARANTLREISFVAVGADVGTYAKLLATLKGAAMTYEEWLKSLGIDAAQWGEAEVSAARRIYDAMQAAQTQASATTDEAARTEQVQAAARTAVTAVRTLAATVSARILTATGANNPNPGTPDLLAQFRTQQAAEFDRIKAINDAARQFNATDATVNGRSLVASAIETGMSVADARREFELHQLRNQRPRDVFAGSVNINASANGTGASGAAVLEAAISMHGGLSRKKLEAAFSAPVLDEAHKRYRGRISLHQILLEAAYANGYQGGMSVKGNLRAILEAAFSNISLPGIFSNTANKWLMEGFNSVDEAWKKIAKMGSVPDFKEVSGYRGVGNFLMQPLASDGAIRHGKTGETVYGNKADTKAIMYGISRQDIINDDLGALTGLPRSIGRGGALALVKDFWTEFMDNAAFFVGGNNNLSTGALSIAGLNAALTKFRKQTDEAGDYIMATPKTLVVPTELEETAMQLYGSRNRGGGATGDSDENPHASKYEPVVVPHLSDSAFTGNSTTAYYLLADPQDVPVIEVVFLDGVQTPTVETADANFNTLGVEMRGYFDYGVRKQEFRGGVKSTGV